MALALLMASCAHTLPPEHFCAPVKESARLRAAKAETLRWKEYANNLEKLAHAPKSNP